MASTANNHHQQATEMDSGAIDSLASTPRSALNDVDGNHHPAAAHPQRVRFMCSFGGSILPRPHDNQLRYMGGDTRIVAVNRHAGYSALIAKLSKLCGTTSFSIKYQLPNEELDSLITVSTDEDVENMMDEYDRLAQLQKSARLRVFLFPTGGGGGCGSSRASSISSLLDGSIKREHWFLDALNGGSGRVPGLERGQSEVSSIISEVPDYLFGLDHSDDHPREPKLRHTKSHLNENHPGSDPGSPNPVASSPFCSTSSSLAPASNPAIPPDLPPVKTKPVNPNAAPVAEPVREAPYEGGGVVEGGSGEAVMSQQQTGYTSGPMWHYPGQPMQQPMPVYYVRSGNLPVQQVQMGSPYVHQQIPMHPGQVPLGYSHQVYGGGGGGARGMTAVDHQPVYYGVRNAGMVPNYPGMVVPSAAEEIQGPGGVDMGRISQS